MEIIGQQLGADNGNLYTAYGDGTGFGGSKTLSLGFAEVSGDPFSSTMHGNNFKSSIDATGGSTSGIKASGLLMVNKILFVFARNYIVQRNYRHSRLAVSTDHGSTWKWASWYFSNTFGAPDFVQYGPNYQDGDPHYVYIVSQDNNDAYTYSQNVVLARVPKNQINNRNAYEFFSGTSTNPSWSNTINQSTPIFHDPNGTQRVSMSYNKTLNRYFLVTSHDDGTHAKHDNALGVFDSCAPWGPWSTDYYSNNWSIGESYEQKFPPKYISSDGKTMWILFSGQKGTPYQYTLRKVVLQTKPASGCTSTPTPSTSISPSTSPVPTGITPTLFCLGSCVITPSPTPDVSTSPSPTDHDKKKRCEKNKEDAKCSDHKDHNEKKHKHEDGEISKFVKRLSNFLTHR